MQTSKRNSLTFFIEESGTGAKSFYYSLLSGFIFGCVSIASRDSNLQIAIMTILATSIAFWLQLGFYLHGQDLIQAEKQNSVTRRTYWKRYSFAVNTSFFIGVSALATNLAAAGKKKAIGIANSVSDASIRELQKLGDQPSPPDENAYAREKAARVAASYFGDSKLPDSISASLVLANAGLSAPSLPRTGIIGGGFLVSGLGGIGLRVKTDVFISHVKIIVEDHSKLAGQAIQYIPQSSLSLPTVIVFDSVIDGGAQQLDGIIWINVIIKNCSVFSRNFPIKIVNVAFIDCVLGSDIVGAQPKLARAILSAGGSAITYIRDRVER